MPALKTVRPTAQTIADFLDAVAIAKILRSQLGQQLRRRTVAADAAAPGATVQTLVLPDDAKASDLRRVYVRTGTVNGEFTVVAPNTTPATTQASVQPNGDIMFLAADAVGEVDVVYTPARGEVVSLTLPVVSNVLAIPAAYTALPSGVIMLLDANAVAATSTGRKRILAPSGSTPSAGQALLNVAKTQVTFASADAVTSATIKLLVLPSVDLDTVLEAETSII